MMVYFYVAGMQVGFFIAVWLFGNCVGFIQGYRACREDFEKSRKPK